MLKWTNEETCNASCLWKPCKEIPSNSAISFIGRSPRKPASFDAPLRVLPSPMERAITACQQRAPWAQMASPPTGMMLSHWLKAAWGQHGLAVAPRGPERGGWWLAHGNPLLNEGWEGDTLAASLALARLSMGSYKMEYTVDFCFADPTFVTFCFLQSDLFLTLHNVTL